MLARVERAARQLRSAADGAATVIELSRTQASEQRDAATAPVSRAQRLQKTGSMLARLVLGYRLFGLRTAFSSLERAELLRQQLHAGNAARFLHTSREQGGAFLKVGQLLSARADLLPEIWVRQLSTLQDAAPAIPADDARRALHRALGADLDCHFEAFDCVPLAAASIGQVHRARTRSGLDVAVKLQRPGIAERVEDDLVLLALCCDALRSSLPPLALDTIVQQICQHVRAELDYVREAELTGRAARFFADHPSVIVPEPVPELCGPELLTTRFIEARKISDVLDELSEACSAERLQTSDKADDLGESRAPTSHARLSELLGLLLEAYLRQIFLLGTFQADPHPGNLMVTPQGELVIVDFGCAGELTAATRAAYGELLAAFFARDDARLAAAFDTLGFRTQSGRPDTLILFMQALLGELAEAVEHGYVRWPDRAALGQRARALGRTLTDDPVIELPDHFVMIGRVLTTLGGLFSHYRPNLDVTRHVLPVLAEASVRSGGDGA